MNLVVDSNIFFSAIISPRGKTAELLLLADIKLYSVRTLETEILKHKPEIIKKTSLSKNELEILLTIFLNKIKFLEYNELENYLDQAKRICPDKDDTAFFAVCLTKNFPLWSNDKKLKQQNIVKVINTEELIKICDNHY